MAGGADACDRVRGPVWAARRACTPRLPARAVAASASVSAWPVARCRDPRSADGRAVGPGSGDACRSARRVHAHQGELGPSVVGDLAEAFAVGERIRRHRPGRLIACDPARRDRRVERRPRAVVDRWYSPRTERRDDARLVLARAPRRARLDGQRRRAGWFQPALLVALGIPAGVLAVRRPRPATLLASGPDDPDLALLRFCFPRARLVGPRTALVALTSTRSAGVAGPARVHAVVASRWA